MDEDLIRQLDELVAKDKARAEATATKSPPPVGGNSRAVQGVDDAGRLFADGATFGYADKIAAKGDALLNSGLGLVGLGSGRTDYDKNLAEERQRTADARERLGWGGTAAEIGGAVMSPVGLAGRMVSTTSVPLRIGAGAVEGGALAKLDSMGHDTPLTAQNVLMGAGVGGALGAISRSPIKSQLTPEQQRLAQVLGSEGVPLSAGQATGSKALRTLESSLGDMPGAGAQVAKVNDAQARGFNRAVARRMGENVDRITPEVLDGTATRLGKQFDNLASRNVVALDDKFGAELTNAYKAYAPKLDALKKPLLDNIVMDLITKVRQGGGALDGVTYQTARSDIGRMAQGYKQSDPTLHTALKKLQSALDDAAERSIRPEDAGAWQQTNRQYRNFKTIQKAMAGAGEKVAAGDVSPSQLRSVVSARDADGYSRGTGDLAQLSRAGEALLKPLPNSGTAPRNMMMGAVGAAGGALMSGNPALAITAASPIIGGALAGRALHSSPVQNFLRARALGMPQGVAGRAALYGAYGGGLLGATQPNGGQ